MKITKFSRSGIIKVGDGRGFIVERGAFRFIITAAHCLPHLPPCHLMTQLEEITYRNLVGHLDGDGVVWVECIFADPVQDIAVLGTPDDQELSEQADLYKKLTGAVMPVQIREAVAGETAWVLDLGGEFKSFVLEGNNRRRLWGKIPEGIMKPGMSGSPILGDDGLAISLCNIGGPSPDSPLINLEKCLPGWF